MNNTGLSSCTLFTSATVTSSGTGAYDKTSANPSAGKIIGLDQFSIADVELDVTVATGTSPTLNVYIQKLLPDAANWTDIIAFTQVTSSAIRKLASIRNDVSVADYTVQDAALTAGNVKLGNFGHTWRVKYVISGTNPSYTFSVKAAFKTI